jgi:uncharacterized surface protein with fasciclin (FAS1) repeats
MPVAGILLIAFTAVWTSCEDDLKGKTFLTSDDLMIDDYITQQDPAMSSFLDVADKAGFRGMLHAYGNYTCFIPTNDALASYLQSVGKSSVADLTEEECITIVKYHVVRVSNNEDSLTTVNFIDGRLPIANMLAKYVTVRAVTLSDGALALEVNRQAIILQKDIRAANGYIQKIDHVLIPPGLTAGEQILALPDEYSLFASVMQRSGWTDSLTLDKADGVWYTVFLQSNEAFAAEGIQSEGDLLEKLRVARFDIGSVDAPAPATMSKDDSLLWTFAAYHVVKSLNYVADLAKISSLLSRAPNQAITFQLKKDSILVNEYVNPVSGAYEKGALIAKKSEYTDLSCYNGVLVDVERYIGPVVRAAQALYWDICEQPEYKKHPNFRKGAVTAVDTRNMSELWCYNEKGEEINGGVTYGYAGSFADKGQYVNHDYMGYRTHNFAALDFKLPLLTPGTYNVWVCYRRDGGDYGSRVRYVFKEEGEEDQVLSTSGLYRNYDGISSEADMLNKGMKRYTAKKRVKEHSAALLFGAITVKSTGRHILRLEVVNKGTRSTDSFLDMIEIIPLDDNQFWPRFDMEGKMCWPDTPCEEIYPYEAQPCASPVDY